MNLSTHNECSSDLTGEVSLCIGCPQGKGLSDYGVLGIYATLSKLMDHPTTEEGAKIL